MYSSQDGGHIAHRFPFLLELEINSGKGLPVMDIATSDPYAKVSVNELTVGRTKTCYRSINPDWGGHSLEIPLLHTKNNALYIQLWDENTVKADELMGRVKIDIETLPLNHRVEDWDFEVLDNDKAFRGTINVSYKLSMETSIIELVPDIEEREKLKVVKIEVADAIEEKLNRISAPEPVRRQFRYSHLAMNPSRFQHYNDFLSDFLYDIENLTKLITQPSAFVDSGAGSSKLQKQEGGGTEQDDRDEPFFTVMSSVPTKVIQNCSYVQSSMRFDVIYLRRGQGVQWRDQQKPIGPICIVMHFKSSDESSTIQVVVMKVKNRHILRQLTAWLVVGIELAVLGEGSVNHGDLPDFASNEYYQVTGTLEMDGGIEKECMFTINLNSNPRQLCFKTDSSLSTFSIDLSLVEALEMSRSTSVSKGHLLSVQAFNVTISPYKAMQMPTVDDAERFAPLNFNVDQVSAEESRLGKNLADKLDKLHPNLRVIGRRAITGLTPGGFVNAASVFSGKVSEKHRNSRRSQTLTTDIGMGNAINNLGKQLIDTVVPETTMCYQFVIKNSYFRYESRKAFGNKPIFDETCIDIALAHSVLSSDDGWKKSLAGLIIFLFDCTLGTYTLIGQKHMHVAELLNLNDKKLSDIMAKGDTGDAADLALEQVDGIFLNDEISVSVNLLAFTDLYVLAHSNPGGHYFTVALVDNEGKTVYQSTIDNRLDSTVVIAAVDGLYCADYVRLDLYDGNLVGYVSCGSIFIPMKDFENPNKTSEESHVTYEVVRVDSWKNYDENDHDYLGCVTVRLAVSIDSSGPGRASLSSETMLFRSNSFTTAHVAETLPMGSIAHVSNDDFVETFSIVPAYDSLILLDSASSPEDKETSNDVASKKKRGAPSTPKSPEPAISPQRKTSTLGRTPEHLQDDSFIDEVEMEVFENSRRALSHNLDWQRLKKNGFSGKNVKDACNFRELKEARPPPGRRWVDEWVVDKGWTTTDKDGWVYAIDFEAMKFNIRSGIHFTSPFMQSVKRRKWVRAHREAFENEDSEGESDEDFDGSVEFHSGKGGAGAIINSKKSIGFLSKLKGKMHISKQSTKQKLKAAHKSSAEATWRSKLLEKFPNSFISLSQERKSQLHPVCIPWRNVKSVALVSRSELFIVIDVNRYIGIHNSSNKDSFRPAEAAVFITGCDAESLKNVLDERKMFSLVRNDLCTVIAQGELFSQHDIDTIKTQSYMEAEEMPLGSRLITSLDEDAMYIEQAANRLMESELSNKSGGGQQSSERTAKTWSKLTGRAFRLRIYTAMLLAAQLKGRIAFDAVEIRAQLDKDFQIAHCINAGNEIDTANDRVEYLIDIAEMRLRELTLCGWDYRGRKLNECLSLMANGYFVEMIGILGSFFEFSSIRQVRGMGGKLELIRTVMKHNDRLAMLLDSVCKPYMIKAQPEPQLSYFLNVDTLLAWYSNVIQSSMIDTVDQCVGVWEDTDKKTSKLVEMYHYPLPWVHDRDDTTGLFRTFIPEDTTRALFQYICIARLNKNEIAPSFHENANILDVKIHMAYLTALIHLGERYWKALYFKDWTVVSAASMSNGEAAISEELEENCEWICSMINDSYRCVCDSIADPPTGIDWDCESVAEKTSTATVQCYLTFKECMNKGLDWLICVITSRICHLHEFKPALHSRQILLQRWLSTVPDLLHDGSDSIVIAIGTAMLELVQNQSEFLDDFCYIKLMQFSSDKICAVYFTILQEARAQKIRFSQDGPEILQMERDLNVLEQKFAMHVPKNRVSEATEHFQILNMLLRLISTELGGDLFDEAIDFFERLAVSNCNLGENVVLMVKTVVKLRFDCRSRREDDGGHGATSRFSSIFSSGISGSPDRKRGPFDMSMDLPTGLETDKMVVAAFTRINQILEMIDPEDSHSASGMISGDRKFTSGRGLEPIHMAFPVCSADVKESKQPLSRLLVRSAKEKKNLHDNPIYASDPLSGGDSIGRLRVLSCHTSTLFCVNSTRQPHLYLEFSIDNRILHRSEVVKDTLLPNWGDEDIILDTRGAGTRDLEVKIIVKNYILSDQLLGVVKIPLLSQDLCKTEEAHPIDFSVNEASAEAFEDALSKTGLLQPVFYITLVTQGP
jgi:hypothetical protein